MTRPAKHSRLGLAVGVGACAVIAAAASVLLVVTPSSSDVPAPGAVGSPARRVSAGRDVRPDPEPRPAPRPARVVVPGAGDLSELTARIDELEASQDDLWTGLTAQDTASHDVAAPVSEPDYLAAITSGMASRLAEERADPLWAPETERLLADAVAAAGAEGSSLVAVDCRATLCRLEVRHDGELARDSFTTGILSALPFDTEMFYRHIDDDSGSRTISYVARAGHLLPRSPTSSR